MGHTYAEMHVEGEETFSRRYAEYQQRCAKEISDLIKRNPIKGEDIQIGDRVQLYKPLQGLSRVRFENKGERNRIRELFRPQTQYFSMNMWALSWANFFTVWDKRAEREHTGKRDHEKISYFIRIDEPPKPFGSLKFALDFNPHWVDIKYFSKQ